MVFVFQMFMKFNFSLNVIHSIQSVTLCYETMASIILWAPAKKFSYLHINQYGYTRGPV